MTKKLTRQEIDELVLANLKEAEVHIEAVKSLLEKEGPDMSVFLRLNKALKHILYAREPFKLSLQSLLQSASKDQ
jgi:hypothetical protein